MFQHFKKLKNIKNTRNRLKINNMSTQPAYEIKHEQYC